MLRSAEKGGGGVGDSPTAKPDIVAAANGSLHQFCGLCKVTVRSVRLIPK